MASAKRKRVDNHIEASSPRKKHHDASNELHVHTPSRRARGQPGAENGTPRSILKKTNGIQATTPRTNRTLLFETPSKPGRDATPNDSPTVVRNADRSARRKSNRRLLQQAINGADSDQEALDDDETLAQHILDADGEEGQHEPDGAQETVPLPETPSKRGRGRPKGSGKGGKLRKQPSPPPSELPAHEEYFWQNRPGGTKTSNNTLSSHSLLNHDEYFQAMQSYHDRHGPEMEFLLELHQRAYDQWVFELEEGFNICLYGYGSKLPITERFTAHLYKYLSARAPYKRSKKTPKIAVVDGYVPGTSIKEILITIASTIVPPNTKMPNQPASLLTYLLDFLSENPPAHPIPVIINSVDSPWLRRSPTPSMLASLAAHPSINMVCTADTPNFPLLWDVGLRAQYQFLFHDATTFAPYEAEIDVVETVNELLGRSGRRIGGRDGVGFVLRSLPENARSLFRIIVTEQLALLLMDNDTAAFNDDDHITATPRNKKVAQTRHGISESTQGVEYRVLYNKAVEEFVCSSEVGFRTLLKEFHDHQMIVNRNDAMGTERLWIPFLQEELEGLAEDLSGDIF
ncbi:origin recognition complex subunit 2-domain-containing protein [Massariosphaeria phaeospora]|uniref:Origin recognition complex subunit 2 n=1 Tax=Massariosphaeria phaeospora TaxID=100035 RepID=A0A7C8I183_9PLEO|nr:origin recognition complex subunit 2-domain-containing protein [Massariosphaeria phaeospora]